MRQIQNSFFQRTPLPVGALLIGLLTYGAAAHAAPSRRDANNPNSTVVGFEIGRYAGEWYEIARTDIYPTPICKDSVNIYTHSSDQPQRLSALHSCSRAGVVIHRADGELEAADPGAPARLTLTAHSTLGPKRQSDYNIIALDPNYGWAAISGNKGHHVWILSRVAALPETTLRAIAAHLDQNLGFTGISSRLRCVSQSAAQSSSCTDVFGRF
jgi:apolipoprotein D and lipocalin family protein